MNRWPILIGGAIVIVILAFFALVNRPATPVSTPQSASEDAFWKKLREDSDKIQRESDQRMKQMFDEQRQQLFDLPKR